MKSTPIEYWRECRQQQEFLGKEGEILAFTGSDSEENSWKAIINCQGKRLVMPLIANSRKPQIGDSVVGVLRIYDRSDNADLIRYGVKFQLKEELL